MPKQRIKFLTTSPSLDTPITIPFIRKIDFTPELIASNFIKVCQSKRALQVNNLLEIKAQVASIPIGYGGEFDLVLKKNKTLIVVKNNDNLCGVRAFVIGKLIADKVSRLTNLLAPKNNGKIEALINSIQEMPNQVDLNYLGL
jgi:hypothetical protein